MSWSGCIVFVTVSSTLIYDSLHSPCLSKHLVLMRQVSSGHIQNFHFTTAQHEQCFDYLQCFLGSFSSLLYCSVSDCRSGISQRGVKLVLNFGWLQKRSNTQEIKGKYFPRISSKGTPLGWKYSKGHTDWKKSLQRPELPIFKISVLTTSNSLFEQTSLVVPFSLCCLLSVCLGNHM